MNVLLVDDDKDITTFLSRFLNVRGFEIVVTNDPMEGLRHIQQEHYDVILLDISMPGLSGLNIIGILATDEILKNQNIFIFSTTSIDAIQNRELLRKDGINGCLEKPIQLNELLTAITS